MTTAEIDISSAPFTWKTLTAISRTEFVPATLRGKPEAILAAVLAGRELGMGPMESLRTIDMIDGKPSPSAEWMVGKVFDAGHVIVADEQTAKGCTVTGVRYRDGAEQARMSFTFTWEMAERAGLTKKSNWKNYPEAMLYWRATSQLCRQFFPDVLRGLKYLPDELGADWDPPLVDIHDGAGTHIARIRVDDTVGVVDPETGEIEELPVLPGQETLEYSDDDPERPFE